MWTETTRGRYERPSVRYSTDLTNKEFFLIEGLLPARSYLGRPRTTDARNGSSEPQSALINEAADAQPTQGTYMAQRPSGSGIVACE